MITMLQWSPILSLVPNESLSRVQAAAPVGLAVRQVALADMDRELRSGLGTFVVVDPTEWHAGALQELGARVVRNGARLVLYGPLTRMLCAQIAALSTVCTPEVVLRDVDDSPTALRLAMTRHLSSAPALMLHGLAMRLVLLRTPLAERTASLFAWAPIPRRVSDFLATVHCSEKSILSWYDAAGLRATSELLAAARIARAYELLRENVRVAIVRETVGFGSDRAMRDNFGKFLQLAPTRAAHLLATDGVAALLLAAVSK